MWTKSIAKDYFLFFMKQKYDFAQKQKCAIKQKSADSKFNVENVISISGIAVTNEIGVSIP